MRSLLILASGVLTWVGCTAPEDKDTGRPPRPQDDTAGLDSGEPDTDDPDTDDSATDTAPDDTSSDETGDTGVPTEPLPICINELMADNQSALTDELGETPDWIELHNPGDAAVDLSGWRLSDDRETPDRYAFPDGTVLDAGAFLLLYADEYVALGGPHLSFSLAADGGEVDLFAPDGRASLVTYGQMYGDFAAARITDCCTGDGCWDFAYRGTPGVTNEPIVLSDVTLLAAGSAWRYLEGAGPPAGDWTATTFDDSTWATGRAPLGYGDSQTTVLDYGADPYNKYATYYFRTSFEVTGAAAYQSFVVSLMRDDGAIVYLNGAELIRSNMPMGTVDSATLASTAVGGAEETSFLGSSLDPALLLNGTNVLAVEVHQATVDSSDVSFDLSVTGSRPARE